MKRIKILFPLLAVLLLIAHVAIVANAESAFYIRPNFTENQKQNTGYFYINIPPKQAQQLSVDVVNPTDAEIAVRVELLDAVSASLGEVDYTAPDKRDPETSLSLTDVARLSRAEVTLAPGTTTTVNLTVQMPEEAFVGEILGALRFSQLPDPEQQDVGGVKNLYAYLISVRLEQGDTMPPPAFTLQGISPHAVYGENAMIVNIYNQAWRVVKDAQLTIELTDEAGDKAPFVYEASLGSFAPCSVMRYVYRFPRENLPEPGIYTARVTLTFEGEQWLLEAPLEIPPEA